MNIIYRGLINQKSIKQIHTELYQSTINAKKQGIEGCTSVFRQSSIILLKINKKLPKQAKTIEIANSRFMPTKPITFKTALSMIVFDLLDENNFNKIINEEARIQESKSKDKVIDDEIESNRHLKLPKIFYLASEHKDCAEDHKDYQGKIYVDEKWKTVIQDDESRKKISDYINLHNVKTFQWVTSKPVWFITRPNCRHYFKALDTEDVLNTSVTGLIKQNNMYSAIGKRAYLQTLKHSTSVVWYKDVRNAELIIEKYKERLKYHETLYATFKNDLIKNAISKDKFLIKKWEKYLQDKNVNL